MTSEDYEKYFQALDAAAREQIAIREQIKALEKREARLEETIATLLRLINDEDTDPTTETYSAAMGSEVGLTDIVRNVLKASDSPMTPVQVRDGVIKMGKNESDYSNLLASIHNILKRLEGGNEVRRIDEPFGTYYEWVGRPHWGMSLANSLQNLLTEGKPALDPFVGQGSGPSMVVGNPPYERAQELLKGPPKKDSLKEAALKPQPVRVERRPKKKE
ncbi:MAG TPA: hypothetical protein VNZ44_12910 [Pyrinomonadaceae bacterium]|nr:hypothetical protein [Pyrinomonadaceae bacterium]